jgi:D-alanine-D-alanine ligase
VEALHILVLMGGWSAEREVSLTSGNGVADALESRGHRVTRLDMGRDVAARIAEAAPDVVFNALHGTPGEDGTVQGMLDLMGVPYTHSGLETSVVAIDKELTKKLLVPGGIRMPGGHVVESESLFSQDPLPRPYVLKPVNEGGPRSAWRSSRARAIMATRSPATQAGRGRNFRPCSPSPSSAGAN